MAKNVYDFNQKMHGKYVIRFHFLIHSIFDGKLPFKSLFFLLFCISASFSSAAEVDFARDIQPIFAEHCTNCHGPDKQKGGLNLTKQDSVLSKLKSGNHAVIAGKPNQSELMRRLTTRDEDNLMPPPDKGKKLSDREILDLGDEAREDFGSHEG